MIMINEHHIYKMLHKYKYIFYLYNIFNKYNNSLLFYNNLLLLIIII